MRPPGSKSITNRALICAALAKGESLLTGALDSEDTRVMLDSLAKLGLAIDPDLDQSDSAQRDPALRQIRIRGCGGQLPAKQAELYIANSGTSVRFLTALVATGEGTFTLDGTPRMRERPIADLLASLKSLGVVAESVRGTGCPPVVVTARGLPGGTARVRGNVSSQFLSGLLMAAPYARQPLTIRVEGELVSQPYVAITLAVMQAFGIDVPHDEYLQTFVVPTAKYQAREYAIEPDASAASYWFAAAAITGGQITVTGLDSNSLQGDTRFVDVLQKMGCMISEGPQTLTVTGGKLRGIDIDMNAISDTVQSLAVVALFAEGPTRVRGVAHNRHKETDRIGNLAIELRKLGAKVDEHEDGLTITPQPLHSANYHGATIATYDDHRMAMSLALAGLRIPGVEIENPRCVEKTYPEFFQDLEQLLAQST